MSRPVTPSGRDRRGTDTIAGVTGGPLIDPARRNLAVYSEQRTVDAYASEEWTNAWLCIGERLLVGRLAREARGGPLLDIGVGGGRTVGLLRLITDDYVAIDYSPGMVAAALAAYPDVDIRVGDGRDLSMFDDGHFSAVVFTFNGVDSVSHDDRTRVFSEMRRVLRPGGLLFFSTLNKDGARRISKPWRDLRVGSWPEWRRLSTTQRARRLGVALAVLAHRIQMLPDWFRIRILEEDHGSWGMSTLGAHGFKLLSHTVTPTAARAELAVAGFVLLEMVDSYGTPVGANSLTSSLFILARKGDATQAAHATA
jgi:SAM-dependent methyltransferase